MKANETIKAASIGKVFDKAGNFILWLVRSNSDESVTYHVRCRKIGTRCFWMCDCYAGKSGHYNGFGTKKCAHVRAICEIGIARREARKAKAIAAANEYRRELEQSPWTWATTSNRTAHPAVVEAERQLAEERRNKIESFSFYR